MCGRFANAITSDQLKTSFKVQFPESLGHNRRLRYNISPGTDIETVVHDDSDTRKIAVAHWGREVDWSPRPLINAKGETLFGKRSFSDAARSRRCLVVATGWFEWKAPKQPYFMKHYDGSPMAMGGLWWGDGDNMNTVIVTRGAEGELGKLHRRAPLLLRPDEQDAWLCPDTPQPTIEDLVVETDGDGLEIYPVAAEVGSVSNDHEGLTKISPNHN